MKKTLSILALATFLSVPSFASKIENINGQLYATGFTGRATTCDEAKTKAEDGVRLYCSLLAKSLKCGKVVEQERKGGTVHNQKEAKSRCAVRVMVEILDNK